MANITPVSPPNMPWQTRQLSYSMKLLVGFGGGLLLIISLISGVTWLLMVPSMLMKGPGPNDTIGSMIVFGTLLTLMFILSVVALVAIWPFMSAQTSFKTSYGVVSATVAGHPFDVRYQPVRRSRRMRGKGTLRFDPQGLTINGYLTPSPWLQIAVVLVVTLIPLVFLGIGLGLIPALLIAFYIGRKRIEVTLPYYNLSDLNVKGCRITMSSAEIPRKLVFDVTPADGERLYRELLPRFPSALKGWQG